MYMLNNHCHRVTAHLPLNILLLLLLLLNTRNRWQTVMENWLFLVWKQVMCIYSSCY